MNVARGESENINSTEMEPSPRGVSALCASLSGIKVFCVNLSKELQESFEVCKASFILRDFRSIYLLYAQGFGEIYLQSDCIYIEGTSFSQ